MVQKIDEKSVENNPEKDPNTLAPPSKKFGAGGGKKLTKVKKNRSKKLKQNRFKSGSKKSVEKILEKPKCAGTPIYYTTMGNLTQNVYNSEFSNVYHVFKVANVWN